MHEHHGSVRPTFSVLICSSSRTKENDTTGKLIRDLLITFGFHVSSYDIVNDNKKTITEKLFDILTACNIVVISGGTGITNRDVTIDAVRTIADREVSGFGMQFQILSMKAVGTSAMLSSATAFLIGRKLVFCIPGSTEAARLAVNELIIPEADHIMYELNR